MFLLISMSYTSIPKREDALLSQSRVAPIIDASGSIGCRNSDGKCKQTFPNQTIVGDPNWDWCSNIGKSKDDHPWVSYRFPSKAMKIRGYSVRNGCCFYHCCCDPETDEDFDLGCCCRLYSFSLQGSNNNKTWKTLHKVESDRDFYECQVKTYEFDLSEPFFYVRFVLDSPWPGCVKCLQLNQIELYGETIHTNDDSYEGEEDNEESVSIIGKVKKYS